MSYIAHQPNDQIDFDRPRRSVRPCYRGKFTMKPLAVTIALAASIAVTPAWALTGEDIANKMDTKQNTAYIFGAAEMAVELFHRMGDTKRANCIIDWLGESEAVVKDVHYAMEKNPTARAGAVMEAVMKQRCGDYK